MEATIQQKTNASLIYKTALLTTTALIVFFLLMKFMNLVTIVELRFINFFIVFFGVRHVLLQTRKMNDGKLEYLKGMGAGFLTAVFTAVFFGAFVLFYLQLIDHDLMKYIRETQPFGNYLTPASSALIVVIEGAASGAIIAFALMHLFNRDRDQG